MQIELYIDGEKKTFTAPYVPYLAKRKYLEVMAEAEKRENPPTIEEQLQEDDAIYSILSDVVFGKQFTLEDIYVGTTVEYAQNKMREAVFGKKPKGEEGNKEGK